MWILKRLRDEVNVICIPFSITTTHFTIGRIECSLNITDDKSVSRRHAHLSFKKSNTGSDENDTLFLTDLNSKFGSYLNDTKLTAESPVALKENDLIKFGGTTSEFVVKRIHFTVVIDGLKRKEHVEMITRLSKQFSFNVYNREQLQLEQQSHLLKESSLLIVYDESIKSLYDKSLLFGLANDANFVTVDYFYQLTKDSNNFSLALIQPTCSALFSPNLLLSKSGRKDIFKKAFEGCSRLYAIEEETCEILRSFLQKQERVAVQFLSPQKILDIRFCDLLVVSEASDVKSLKFQGTSRIIKLKSLIEAFIHVDNRHLEIETVYSNSNIKDLQNSTDDFKMHHQPLKDMEHHLVVKEDIKSLVLKKTPISFESITSVTTTTAPNISTSAYEGPSLTCVLPIPANFLRSSTTATVNSQTHSELQLSDEQEATQTFRKRFVKCHPVSYCPGSIPALIGPEQLQQVNSNGSAVVNIGSASAESRLKRRILVKDSWLAEDDLIDVVPTPNINPYKENLSNALKSTNSHNTHSSSPSLLDLTDSTVASKISCSNIGNSNILATDDTNITAFTGSTTTTTLASTSKFQSSFFKSLAKK